MYLKIIFLEYLRELNQIDQCFNQNLLECDVISYQSMNIYFTSINNVMNTCVTLLSDIKNNKVKPIIDCNIVNNLSEKLEGMNNQSGDSGRGDS